MPFKVHYFILVLSILPNEDDTLSFSIFKLFVAVISSFNVAIENTPIGFALQFRLNLYSVISVHFMWSSEKGQQLFVIHGVYCVWKSTHLEDHYMSGSYEEHLMHSII